jgi:hypothetical protein
VTPFDCNVRFADAPALIVAATRDVRFPREVRDEAVTVAFNVVPVKVAALAVTVPEPPKLIDVPFTVTEELARPLFGIAELIALAGIEIVELLAAVRRPCASTVKFPTTLALP